MGSKKNKKTESLTTCVCDSVALINDLQNAIDDNEDCQTGCERAVRDLLNNNRPQRKANTRPFLLFTEEGKPFRAFFKSLGFDFDFDEDEEDEDHDGFKKCRSPFFLVENVDDEKCCAVLRVLQPKDDFCEVIQDPQENLVTTNSCITVDLNCFCAIQCLGDVYLKRA